MKAFLFLIFLLAAPPVLAQGILMDDDLEPNDSLYNAMEAGNMLYGSEQSVAAVKSFSMRTYVPVTPVPVSGGLTWTTAISKAMSAQLGFEKQWSIEKIEQETFSPYFLFDMLPKASPNSCKLQTDWMKQTQLVLVRTGNVRLADYSRKTSDCHQNPPPALWHAADRYPVRAFTKLFVNEQSDRSASIGQKQFVMKRSLGRKHPVVMCIMADQGFAQLKTDHWTPRFSSARSVFQAVIVVGFDDNKQAFEIAHPAGRGWGKGGFAWISYKDLIYAKYAFEITMEARPILAAKPRQKLNSNIISPMPGKLVAKTRKTSEPAVASAKITSAEPRHIKLSGALTLNTVDPEGNFINVPAHAQAGGYYVLEKQYGVSSQFQLVGSGGTASSFIYVISVDPAGKAELHYPYLKKYGMGVFEMGSPLLPEPQSQVVIPEPVVSYDEQGNQFRKERVFVKERPGTDWLITLYSDQRLDNEIGKLIYDLTGHNEDFPQRFRQVFDKYLVPNALVRFEKGRMNFSTGPMTKAYVVPVILKIEGD